jgi:hypothetical protein
MNILTKWHARAFGTVGVALQAKRDFTVRENQSVMWLGQRPLAGIYPVAPTCALTLPSAIARAASSAGPQTKIGHSMTRSLYHVRFVEASPQKFSRSAKSTKRGKLPCERTLPKLLLPNDVFGERNSGVFKAFKASNRNWALKRS